MVFSLLVYEIEPMRINGRLLRYSTIAERRILKSFGVDFLKVPRDANPFAVARSIRRMAKQGTQEAELVRRLVEQDRRRNSTGRSPTTEEPSDPWSSSTAGTTGSQ